MPSLPTFRSKWRDSNTARLQTATYAQLWRNFESSGQVIDGRHDTAHWRDQPGKFAAAVVRIPAESLAPAFEELLSSLESLDVARVHPTHFLHIMMQELGEVSEDQKGRHQITSDRLQEFAGATDAAISQAQPFQLELGGVNAFRDSVILEVHDHGVLSRIHRRLHELAAVPTFSPYAYLPHITVAHFTGLAASGPIVRALQPWRSTQFGNPEVSEIEIVLLDMAESYPPFEMYHLSPLGQPRK